jgi:hypothetical protein
LPAAGCGEAGRADCIRALSCLTAALSAAATPPFGCREKTFVTDCGFLLLAIDWVAVYQTNPSITVREITKNVQSFLETIGDFATLNPLRKSVGVIWFICSLVPFASFPNLRSEKNERPVQLQAV